MQRLSNDELTKLYGIESSEGVLVSMGEAVGRIHTYFFRLDGHYDEHRALTKYRLWLSPYLSIGEYTSKYDSVAGFISDLDRVKASVWNNVPAAPAFSLEKMYKAFFNFRDRLIGRLFKLGFFAFFVWVGYKIGFFSLFGDAFELVFTNNPFWGSVGQYLGFLWNDVQYFFHKHLS